MTEPGKIEPQVVERDEELVPVDDAVIGRAFRWSLAVFVVLAAAGAIIAYIATRPDNPTAIDPIQPTAAAKHSTEAQTAAPRVTFTEITTAAGIDFVHFNGATGDKLLPETMGGGCALFDYDSDGDQDILLVNCTNWPDAPAEKLVTPPPTHALYQNDGRGNFTNVTAGSGLDVSFYGMGCAVGDYDNDGDPDLFITAVGENHLYRNDAGHFVDATAAAGVAGNAGDWSTSAGFFDYDNDGRLDLFVCSYVKWSRPIDFEVNYQLVGVGRAYGPPTNFEGTLSALYHNNGNGTFEDVSQAAGIQVRNFRELPMGKALGLAPADVDQDGWMDLLIANDTVQRFFFHNQGKGASPQFIERGAEFGLAFDRNGNATGAMGTDSAYYRNSPDLAFVITNFANEMTSLLVAAGSPTQFLDEAIPEGIGNPTRLRLKFGVFFFDYDLDGRLDLLSANGHIEDEINLVQASQTYAQPAQLFWNAGPTARACFAEIPAASLGDLAKPIVGRGASFGDIDGDGDLDVLMTQIAGLPMLLRNDLAHDARHWLRLRLRGNGASSNRDAIGARIELIAGGVTQYRQVMPTRSYLSQAELPVTFGLGAADRIDSLTVIWPDGTKQALASLEIDREHVIDQAR